MRQDIIEHVLWICHKGSDIYVEILLSQGSWWYINNWKRAELLNGGDEVRSNHFLTSQDEY